MPINPGLNKLTKLQKDAFERTQQPKVDNETFCKLVRTICELDERIRIKRKIPAPKAVDPERYRPRSHYKRNTAPREEPDAPDAAMPLELDTDDPPLDPTEPNTP